MPTPPGTHSLSQLSNDPLSLAGQQQSNGSLYLVVVDAKQINKMLVDILWQPMKQTAVRSCLSACLPVPLSVCLSACLPASQPGLCQAVGLSTRPLACSKIDKINKKRTLTMKDIAASNHLPPSLSISVFVTISVLVWLAKQCSSQLPHNCKQKLQIRLCMPMPMWAAPPPPPLRLHKIPYHISLITVTTFFASKAQTTWAHWTLLPYTHTQISNLLSKFQPKNCNELRTMG